MAGRRPKPTKLKIIEGNPGKRPLNRKEPKPSDGIPDIPNNLSDAAKNVWNSVAPLLQGMGVLTVADGLALERLCECYSEIEELKKTLDDEGRTFWAESTVGAKVLKAHPAAAMLADADRRFKSYLVEFGLTPAARSKVHAEQDDSKESAVKEFFG